jgi:hypothetical protein
VNDRSDRASADEVQRFCPDGIEQMIMADAYQSSFRNRKIEECPRFVGIDSEGFFHIHMSALSDAR